MSGATSATISAIFGLGGAGAAAGGAGSLVVDDGPVLLGGWLGQGGEGVLCQWGMGADTRCDRSGMAELRGRMSPDSDMAIQFASAEERSWIFSWSPSCSFESWASWVFQRQAVCL